MCCSFLVITSLTTESDNAAEHERDHREEGESSRNGHSRTSTGTSDSVKLVIIDTPLWFIILF